MTPIIYRNLYQDIENNFLSLRQKIGTRSLVKLVLGLRASKLINTR